jgi:hypothetical protein
MIAPVVMIAMVVMIVAVVMVVPVVVEVAVVTTIPVMIVLAPSVASIPITRKIPLSVMVGPDPTRTFVWRPGPISLVPLIVMFYRIPIAVHPNEIRPWAGGHHGDHARWRRSADLDSNRDLPMSRRGAESEQEHEHEQQEHRADELLHFSISFEKSFETTSLRHHDRVLKALFVTKRPFFGVLRGVCPIATSRQGSQSPQFIQRGMYRGFWCTVQSKLDEV